MNHNQFPPAHDMFNKTNNFVFRLNRHAYVRTKVQNDTLHFMRYVMLKALRREAANGSGA